MRKGTFSFIAILALAAGSGNLLMAATPITALGSHADIVVLANLQAMTGDKTGTVQAQLQPMIVLKGSAPSSTFVATLAPSALLTQVAASAPPNRGQPGAIGLWFLKKNSDGSYQIIPTQQGNYTEMDAFWPVPAWWSPQPSQTLAQQLLSALSAWYQSLSSPNTNDEFGLLTSLGQSSDPATALAIAQTVMASPSIESEAIGFAAAIQLGSISALQSLATQLNSLQSAKAFRRVTDAIELYLQPSSSATLAVLQQLIAFHSSAPGLDWAIANALGRYNAAPYVPTGGPGPSVPSPGGTASKPVLPLLVQLLDSQDPRAALKAAWLLGTFTQLANSSGNIIQGIGSPNPFRTADTMKYTPSPKDFGLPNGVGTASPATYVSFWKSWWAQNQAKLAVSASTN